MKNKLTVSYIVSVAMFSLFGCAEPITQNVQLPALNDSCAVYSAYSQLDWCDDLIEDYIARSTDELLVHQRQDTSIHLEWYVDRVAYEFGKKYMIFHLGHVVTDEGNTDPRFATNDWLYIDSLSRKLYVLNISNETIVEWK